MHCSAKPANGCPESGRNPKFEAPPSLQSPPLSKQVWSRVIIKIFCNVYSPSLLANLTYRNNAYKKIKPSSSFIIIIIIIFIIIVLIIIVIIILFDVIIIFVSFTTKNQRNAFVSPHPFCLQNKYKMKCIPIR